MAGRYYITRKAGSVPAGELFLALDATDKSGKASEFHLQRYRREFCANASFVAALEAEVAVELTLSHPNILRLQDFGTWEGLCFLVYEKFTSISLSEAIALQKSAGQSSDPLVVAAIGLQLLDVLIYTHGIPEATGGRKAAVFQAGFSPESVDVASSGQVKVRGFTRAGAGPRPNFLDMALGRMPYLAPAIWEGGQPVARTDLYSLGALLWELCTGEPLPKGGGHLAGLRADFPRELELFVSRLLDSRAPFGSAADAKAALEKALFTLSLKPGPGDLAGWHRGLLRVGGKSGLKEITDRGQRTVLAEVVAARKLQVASSADSDLAEIEPLPADAAVPAPAPRKAEAKAPPDTGWEKAATFREAGSTEAEDRAASRALKVKIAIRAAAAVATFSAIAGATWLAFLYRTSDSVPEAVVKTNEPPAAYDLLATFAYDNGGGVVVQGLRNDPAKAFGAAGLKVGCEFLLAPDTEEGSQAAGGDYAEKFNYVFCPQPPSPNHKFVRLATVEEKPRRSNSVPVRATLTWRNLLGPDLQKNRVTWVYRFTCDRTFVEGEGVSKEGEVSCPPSQKLGLLHTIYHYYTRWSEEGKETAEPIPVATDSVCGLTSYSAWRCLDGSKVLLFGLYRREIPPFIVPVSLTRAPVGDALMSVYGYAAETDANGLCPVGLVKVKQWNASPPTLGPADSGGLYSTFRNDTGDLNNRIIESQQPKSFVISRHKSRTPCDGKGNCAFATFDEPAPAFTTPYSPGGEFCVIPPLMENAPLGDETRGAGSGVAEKPTEATVFVKTKLQGFEVLVNGQKVPVKNNSFPVRLHRELSVEIFKLGFKRVKLTLPAVDQPGTLTVEAPAEIQPMGEVDLATFPPAEAIFFLGSDIVFSGQTPVHEKLPAGDYRVKLVNTKIGADTEITLTILEGQTTSVDKLLKAK